MVSEHGKKLIDMCAEQKSQLVTSVDAWVSVGSDVTELAEILLYAKEKGVTIVVQPAIVRPVDSPPQKS